MPNSLAYLSIALWPVVSFILLRKKGVEKGIVLSILISYLFLPANFEINFPGIPAFSKATVTSLSIVAYLIFTGRGLGFKELGPRTLLILFILSMSPFITALFNSKPYLHLPGISLYDGLSSSVGYFLLFLPFMFGFKFFRSYESQVLIFKYIVIFTLIYSIPILYEIRMSPQLHNMIYGFFPHSFAQQVRSGGFRSVVFLGHGLLVALFVAVAFLISLSLHKAKITIFRRYNYNLFIIIFLFIVLLLSKSYMPVILALTGAIFIIFIRSKMTMLFCFCLVFVYISYPFLSANNLFPHHAIVNVAENINQDRAQSINFRFFHEEQLLTHANQKSIVGWGGWGRNRVYDPETFRDLSVTDGRWIITLGTRGWLGFLSELYFFWLSIFVCFLACKKILANNKRYSKLTRLDSKGKGEIILLSTHALIVSFILIDQLPNASMSYFYWFLIGSLLGRSKDVIKNILNDAKPST